MTSNVPSTFGDSVDTVAVLSALLGALVFGYGLLVLSVSVLGGGWIAAIGLVLLLSGAVRLETVGDRLGLSPDRRRGLSLAFAGLAVVLAVAFVAVNGATFEAGEIESST